MREFIMALAYLTGCSPELILSRVNYNFDTNAIAASIDMAMCSISPDKLGYSTPQFQDGEDVWYFVDMVGDYTIMKDVEFVMTNYELGSDVIGFSIYVNGELEVEGASIIGSDGEYQVDI